MVFFIVPTIAIISILIGRLFLGKWLNHLSFYCIIWTGLILMYELRLLPYIDIYPLAWFLIISAFLAFFLGILTITTARKLFKNDDLFGRKTNAQIPLFIDNGKTVKYALILFTAIGLFAALQNWIVLLNMFGSIPGVFLNANIIYKLNTAGGGIKGMVPFIANFGYVAVFFAAIYTAYRGRFSLLSFLPFVGIVLKEVATIGRAGMLLALMEFVIVFVLFRHLLRDDFKSRFKFSKNNAIIATIVLIVFFISAASLVRMVRIADESFTGANRKLTQMEDNIIITPTLYLYLSAHIGVLSKYTASEGENTGFAQNTLLPAYNFLDRFDILERPSAYQRGYFIPMWVNTGTYIRELHADFGTLGAILGPYLLGLLLTFFWFKFYQNHRMIYFVLMVYLNIIVGFSFLVMITRTSYWIISMTLIIISILILERIAKIVHNRSLESKSGKS
jgi:oligosaccharide repeat unit polymerase